MYKEALEGEDSRSCIVCNTFPLFIRGKYIVIYEKIHLIVCELDKDDLI